MATDPSDGGFPVSAGILFGLGLGGFFDGILLHQVLQWHHMPASAVIRLTAWPTSKPARPRTAAKTTAATARTATRSDRRTAPARSCCRR